MGRDYAKIRTSIWGSKKFTRVKGDRPRLLYFYLHTCPQVTSCGCFRIPIKYCVADLGWGANQVAEAIDSLCEALLIAWNESEEIVRIVSFLDHDPPTNPKHAGAVVRTALALPDCREKVAVLHDLLQNEHAQRIEGLKEHYDRLSEAYPEAIETPVPLSLSPVPIPPSLRSGVTRTRLPEDWPTSKDRENAVAYWKKHGREDLVPRLETEIEKARAHHLAKGTRAADWSQAWVTWYARSIEITRAPKNSFPTAKIIKVA